MALTVPERSPCAREDDLMDDPTAMSVENAFDALSAAAPEGWRVELIEGEIHATPPANGDHEEIVSELSGQVRDHRRDLARYTGASLLIPGASPTGKVVPDLVVAPRGSLGGEQEYHPPGPVLLVVEVTSRSTADNDRHRKLRGYAAAGIPCYLLLDRAAQTATLFSQPRSGGRYERAEEVAFSKTLALPDPLGFELDTAEF